MRRATCGHKVVDGISIEIHSFTKEGEPCINYGTYCDKCLIEYYEEGRIANEEFHKFIKRLIKNKAFLRYASSLSESE